LFKFTFTVVFDYLVVEEVYIGYLWTQKIVLGLEDVSLASASKVCPHLTSLVFRHLHLKNHRESFVDADMPEPTVAI